jgi:TRAP-type C4-dicarboxylate transport system substrate-binding protein
MKRMLLAAALLMTAVCAPALTIKLGSLAPGGSPWELMLRRIAAEWGRLSGGSVNVRIYSGGVAGDEPDMVRKMRIGQLNAAAMTVSGLQGIFNGVKTLSFPLFIRSDAELDYVLSRMKPDFEREMESRGFKVVMWSPGGWTYFFSRRPVVRPDDLRRQKLWVWAGDPDEVSAWQSSGFQVVPLASTDIMTSLQGGMIDALVSSPLLTASNQWFGIVSNMCGLRLAPLWGAVVVSTRTWAEIPAELQPRLISSAQEITDSIAPQITNADSEAIGIMKKYGLTITEVPPAAEREWENIVDRGFTLLIGKSYDRASYETARKYLEEYLSSHPRR